MQVGGDPPFRPVWTSPSSRHCGGFTSFSEFLGVRVAQMAVLRLGRGVYVFPRQKRTNKET